VKGVDFDPAKLGFPTEIIRGIFRSDRRRPSYRGPKRLSDAARANFTLGRNDGVGGSTEISKDCLTDSICNLSNCPFLINFGLQA
jgi:hypothetical protein